MIPLKTEITIDITGFVTALKQADWTEYPGFHFVKGDRNITIRGIDSVDFENADAGGVRITDAEWREAVELLSEHTRIITLEMARDK